MIEVPPDRLTEELLQAVLEEFVTREGTDYGHTDISLEQKVAQVERQLQRGEVVIAFDLATESCTLLTRRDFEQVSANAPG